MAQRYVIVGNGPAGATAAEAVRQHDPDGEILIVGAEKHAFYSRPGLAYLLTGQVPEGRLYSRPDRDLERARIRRIIGTVRAAGAEARRLELADGRTLEYDRLLLAVGARAVRPEVPGIELHGVVTLDNLDDARHILRLAKHARRACVVGGGITAVELAEGLAARGVKTTYLMRGERYWPSVLDARESELVEDRLAEDGIDVRHGLELARVVGRRERVNAIETNDGTRLECDLLAIAIGTQARLELAHQLGLETGRGIWVDEQFRTSDRHVFAAGDAAEVLDPATGRRSIDSLWSVAIEQGRTAGANMAGGHEPYRRPAPFNVTKIAGVMTTLIGAVGGGARDADLVALSRGDSGSWRDPLAGFTVASNGGADRLRLVLGEDRILGAVVMGDQTLSRALLHLVRDRVDISGVRDRLMAGPAEVRQALDLLTAPTAPHAV